MAWKKMKLGMIFLLLSAVSFGRSASSSVPKDPFLGISPQDEKFYTWSSETIKCRDGSKKFTKSQLNDEFCDCPDGTDEPGTSACPNGKFYCQNAGHVPQTLFSSRVNDAICDCCDGSDEYSGKVVCKNTCWEAGKVARDKLKKKIATYEEGVALRKQEIEKAKVAFLKDEEELMRLKKEEKVLKGLVQQLKEHKEQIEKAEEKERLQKEKEEKEKMEAEDAQQEKTTGQEETHVDSGKATNPADGEDHTGNADDEIIGTLEDSYDYEVAENKEEPLFEKGKEDSAVVPETGHDSGREATTVHDIESEATSGEAEKGDDGGSENSEGLSKEELGRLVASRWTGENTGKEKSREGDAHEVHGETLDQTHDEDDGYAPDSDDEAENYDSGKYDDDLEDELDETHDFENHEDTSSSYKSDLDKEFDLLDTATPSNPSWLERIQQTVRTMLQAVNLFQTPVNISEATHIRKEYDESSEKLSKIESRISSLTQKLKYDFGPDKEFYSFYGRCFESKQNKYVYKVCPYKQASQVEGHTTTRLGSWDKFEDSYRAMRFANGDNCWNGPDRSIKVRLRCGLQNEIADVDEPSRCEYVAVLSTPAICHEDKLKELHDKLDSLNQELPKHDEL